MERPVPSPMRFAKSAVAARSAAAWQGFGAEHTLVRAPRPVEFDVASRAHVLRVGLHGRRRDGETWAEGAGRSIERNLARRIHFVPAGARIHGWGLPEGPWSFVNVWIYPGFDLVDPSLRFGEVGWAPRLAFQDAGIAETVAKLGALAAADPGPHARLYAEALAAALAVELVRLHDADRASGAVRLGLTSRQLRALHAFADAHLDEEISLRRLADQVGLSPWHFGRAFRRASGETPRRWLQRLRLEWASHLLATTDLPVTAVASSVGFSGPSHFAAAFKTRRGLAPSGFRASLR
jgi:AraC family transcriptional regulator